MPLLIYILKVSVTLILITAFYRVFLRKLTFYRWNRWYLIGYSALAFFLPLLNIYDFFDPKSAEEVRIIAAIPSFQMVLSEISKEPATEVSQWSFESTVFLVLIAGSTILLIRLLVNLASLYQARKKAVLLQDGDVKIYALTNSPSHFSFGKNIFINPENHSSTELERIIMHEYVHVRQKHSLDIIWSELLLLLFWFNPAVWLLKKYIRQNLEFLADNEVISKGISAREYQLLLLKVMGVNPHLVAAPFGFSFLKKRIVMMNKNKTAGIHTVKFLFVLPVIAILLFSFRNAGGFATGSNEDGNIQSGDFTGVQAGEYPETLADPNVDKSFASAGAEIPDLRNEAYPVITDTVPPKVKYQPPKIKPEAPFKLDWKDNMKTLIVTQKNGVKELYDLTDELQRKAFTEKYGPIPDAPATGQVKLEIRQVKDSFYLKKSATEGVMFVIDGVPATKEEFSSLNPYDIESVTVLKDAAAETLYSSKGGVILITTKSVNIEKYPPDSKEVNKYAEGLVGFNGIIIYKGKQFTADEFMRVKVDPNMSGSIRVLKGAEAVKIYGAKAENGVLIIE